MNLSQLRQALQPYPAAGLVLAGAAVTLAGAWTFQYFGYEPCELCLKQRIPYYAALPLAVAAVFFARNAKTTVARTILGLLALIFFGSAIFGGYHAGVEWKFWPGPNDCTGDFVKASSMAEFQKQLQTTRIVRCDEVAIRIFGLSLADWNVLVSAGLALTASLGASALKKL